MDLQTPFNLNEDDDAALHQQTPITGAGKVTMATNDYLSLPKDFHVAIPTVGTSDNHHAGESRAPGVGVDEKLRGEYIRCSSQRPAHI